MIMWKVITFASLQKDYLRMDYREVGCKQKPAERSFQKKMNL